jgi:arabinogalactan oligomer/maltooligosaccharide transport system permease protein
MSSLRYKKLSSSEKRRKQISRFIRYIIALFMIVFAMFPVVWTISASLNPTGSLATQQLIPPNASLANYQALLTSDVFPYLTWLWNSIKVAISVTATLAFFSSPLNRDITRFWS